ncbi:MAG: 7-cyano-7-deazaguanine synthase [Elusimicrobiota bacterium]|jgi:tRNA(Ile)-lysidine synthase TilS/MesJ|nr:7-cyano-7-deazaguanine synthase [Elusimicrobiota bacterium]
MIFIYPNNKLEDNTIIEIKEYDNKVIIRLKNDYIGCDFLYYSHLGEHIYISFNFFELCEFLLQKTDVTINQRILHFFTKYGYAPMDYTIINEIYKLPNLCELVFNRIENHISYRVSINDRYKEMNSQDVIVKTIYRSLDKNKKNIILFSGGLDSTLIAILAKKKLESDNIELVFGKYEGVNFKPHLIDEECSDSISKELNLKIRKIIVDINDLRVNDFEDIIYSQPNSAHFSFIFKKISDFYKNCDVNYISGQQADSILNYGSTSPIKIGNKGLEGFGELIRRYLYMSNSIKLNLVFKYLNNEKKILYRYPQLSLYYGYKKLPIINDYIEYNNLASLYNSFIKKTTTNIDILENNLLFYVFFHLSGSDASGILNIMCSKERSILPFNDINLFSFFCIKKNNLEEIFIPKKAIVDILKKEKIIWNILKNKPNIPNISYEIIFNEVAKNNDLMSDYLRISSNYKINLPFCFNSYHLAKCYEKIYG